MAGFETKGLGNESLKQLMESDEMERMSKKTILFKSMEFKDGNLYIWGIPGMIFSCYSLAHALKISNKSKDIRDVIYWMGYLQGRGATKATISRFGYKKDLIKNVISQGDMLGYGIAKLIKADYKKNHFVFIYPLVP